MKRPLAGVRVLVGRARHQAGALARELRKLGATVIEIPFIEIRQPRSFVPLDAVLRNLNSYDWLILTSVNGVEAMWKRMARLGMPGAGKNREGHGFSRAAAAPHSVEALAAEGRLRIAAIGPATQKAIEERGVKVNVVPKEYVAESVVRSLKGMVKGKRVLLVRAKVARDVIPRELRAFGARVDVVEAYETAVASSSRTRLKTALRNPKRRPDVVTFTSSSTVRNFIQLLGTAQPFAGKSTPRGRGARGHTSLLGIQFASIGPVTSATLREVGLAADIRAKEYTIPGLVDAILRAFSGYRTSKGSSSNDP